MNDQAARQLAKNAEKVEARPRAPFKPEKTIIYTAFVVNLS